MIDVKKYCDSRTSCQQRRWKAKYDRVSIVPIPRVSFPFQMLTLDCIGPIELPSSKEHRYCLYIVDNCTCWIAVYPLKKLDAKSVCDSLLELFMQIDIPIVITSYNSSNFGKSLDAGIWGEVRLFAEVQFPITSRSFRCSRTVECWFEERITSRYTTDPERVA